MLTLFLTIAFKLSSICNIPLRNLKRSSQIQPRYKVVKYWWDKWQCTCLTQSMRLTRQVQYFLSIFITRTDFRSCIRGLQIHLTHLGLIYLRSSTSLLLSNSRNLKFTLVNNSFLKLFQSRPSLALVLNKVLQANCTVTGGQRSDKAPAVCNPPINPE